MLFGFSTTLAATKPDFLLNSDSDPKPTAQVPVTQLRDVQPSDWAYQALQLLIERYNCLTGYPDASFRGHRALTRYEFAAGLNACLDQVEGLVRGNIQTDLQLTERLQQEFALELALLRGRTDGIQARVNELQVNQFSSTTKLNGSVSFAIADVFGESSGDNQTVLQDRVSLAFSASFSGRDVLLVQLNAGNAPAGSLEAATVASGPFELPGVEIATGTIATAEGTLASQFAGNTDNDLILTVVGYSFPVGNRLKVNLFSAQAPFQFYAPTLNPFLDDGGNNGAISVFGSYNPLYAIAGGGAGIVFNYEPIDGLELTAGYLAEGQTAGNPVSGQGLFNGGYSVLGQITWQVSDNFAVAGLYINEYSQPGQFGFNYNGLGVAGTAVANTLAGQALSTGGSDLESPTLTNGYGLQFNWQPSSRLSVSGWFSTLYSRLIGQGDGNILTYALSVCHSRPGTGRQSPRLCYWR
ncbi:MAG: iron uptake porin [Chloroflexaceae bacterium]|nr:iron uptake porin [Chloroflexaceae bacterium]